MLLWKRLGRQGVLSLIEMLSSAWSYFLAAVHTE